MTVNIDWGLANGALDPGAMVQQGFQLGRQQRDQDNLRQALGLLTTDPHNTAARTVVGALDPQLLIATDTANWQRQAHNKSDAFDAAYADYMRPVAPASATPAAPAASPISLAPVPAASAPPPTVPAMRDGSEFGRVDVMGGAAPNAPAIAPPSAPPAASPAITALFGGSVPAATAPGAPALPAAPVAAPTAGPAAPFAAPGAPSPVGVPSGRDEAFARMLAADPAKAALIRQQEAQQRLSQLTALDNIAEHAMRLLGRAVDQPSYEAAGAEYNAELQRNGLPPQHLPQVYSPQVVAALQRSVLDTKAQIETARQEATLAETVRHNRADEDKTKFAPLKVKNAEGGEDVYLFDQATGHFVKSGGASGATGGGSGSAKPGFDAAMEFILPHEGGYAASDGNGQPVNFGINQGANPGVDVKHLTRDGAKQIYRDKYWAESGAEKLPENAQTAFFDTYIINPGRAKALWQQSGGDVNKFLDLRDGWLNGLVASNPGKYGRFQKAWTNRTNDLRTLVGGGDDGEEDGGTPTAGGGMGSPLIHTAGPKNGGLGPDEIHFFAQDVANGGDMPQLGMGKDAAVARQAILKEVAHIRTGQGGDGVDFGVTRATSKADRQALTTLSRNSAGILAFERTARMNGDVALGLADRAGNGGVPVFNRWINAGKTAVAGDPDVVAFHAGVETFANEFAKITSSATGGGVTSDAARQHVYDLINRDQSPAQFKATLGVLYRDMENRRVGLEQQRQALLGRIRGAGASGQAPASPANVPTMTPDQVRAAPSGTVFKTTDGRTMRKR